MLWTSTVPEEVRQRLIWELRAFGTGIAPYAEDTVRSNMYEGAQYLLKVDLAKETLEGSDDPQTDLERFIRRAPDSRFPDILEATSRAVYGSTEHQTNAAVALKQQEEFSAAVNAHLLEHWVSYSLEGNEVIPIDSQEMHVNVTKPTLRLLSGEKWAPAESAYVKALKGTSSDPSRAITDAGTALQEGLRVLGCKGDDFSALMKDAKNSLLKGYDAQYVTAIEKLVAWASAHRAKAGGVHFTSTPSEADAWLAVHVVGALLLRLADKTT